MKKLILKMIAIVGIAITTNAQPITVDPTFNSGGTGFGGNPWVFATALQPDGKIIVGGYFTSYNGGAISCGIARLNVDGSLDASFNTGSGFVAGISSGAYNSFVYSIILQPDGKIIVGGNFSSYNGTTIGNNIARLNPDGTLDASFTLNTGSGTYSGFNRDVLHLALQPDGKIIVGGDFYKYKITTIGRGIARLNADGSRDTSFHTGSGFEDVADIWSFSLQPDGKIIVGGGFHYYNGVSIGTLGIIRLNPDGSLDTSFNTNTVWETGGTVFTLALQPDGKIIVGGNFSSYNGTTIGNGITRLNSDGTRDTLFNAGTGFGQNGAGDGGSVQVNSIALQPDGKIIVGGNFRYFNGSSSGYIARLNSDGSLDLASFNGVGFNYYVYTTSLQPDGGIIVGGLFNYYVLTNIGKGITRLQYNCGTSMGTDVVSACDSYTWIDGVVYTVNNNTAIYTIPNGAFNGCDSVVQLDLTITTCTTGIEDMQKDGRIKVYPNPFTDKINIEPKMEYQLFDLIGREVDKENLSALPIGTYILKTEKGGSRVVKTE